MQYLPIENVIDKLIDYRGKTPKKTDHGVRLITAKVIKKGSITNKSHEFIAEEDYDSWMRRGLPQMGDVLVTTEAPLGEVAQLRTNEKIALAQRVILLRAKRDTLDQNYLLYAMQSDYVQAGLNARATGTTVAGIKQSELRQVLLPIPELKDQKTIAEILSAYDTLIQNNSRRIAILEEMAQSLYQEWFVKFRFPGHQNTKLKESSLGLIPEGWEVSDLDEFIDFWNGKKCTKSESGEFPIYGANGIIGMSDEPKYENGIIIGRVGAYCGAVEYCFNKFWGSDNTIIAKCKSEENLSYLFLLLKTFNLNNFAGGAAQPLLTQATLKKLSFVLPSLDAIEKFDAIVLTAFRGIDGLVKKNKNLKQQRDLLLPKLISGKIQL